MTVAPGQSRCSHSTPYQHAISDALGPNATPLGGSRRSAAALQIACQFCATSSDWLGIRGVSPIGAEVSVRLAWSPTEVS